MGLSKNVVLCALVLGFLGSVNARALAQTGASCEAASFLEIFVTDGSCSGSASVSCDAQASSQSESKIAIEDWVADEELLCADEQIDVAVEAIAKASAKLYVDALVQVSCTPKSTGRACGWGIGSGDAWAVATAKAIAVAAVDLGPERALCEADITALAGVFVEAAGKATAAACQSGEGSQAENERQYVESVREGVANALAWASAKFCKRGSDVIAKSKCAGEASSGGSGSSITIGDGSGTADQGQIPACSPAVQATCCTRRFSNCRCANCDEPWKFLQLAQERTRNGQRVWRNQDDDTCFCVN